jgi:hypothetical protein
MVSVKSGYAGEKPVPLLPIGRYRDPNAAALAERRGNFVRIDRSPVMPLWV